MIPHPGFEHTTMFLKTAIILVAVASLTRHLEADQTTNTTERQIRTVQGQLNFLKKKVDELAKQAIMQELFMEEKTRSDGTSGIKQTRVVSSGTRPYHSDSFSGNRVSAIHEHSNNNRVLGMGEVVVVLNGVEFRTRHNDYGLYMPHRTSKAFHEIENVTYPDVPQEVTKKPTVAEQITEMREWFKAFKNQDHSVRDYRKYFKPVLSYMEGGWTTARNIQEAFPSDRHSYDAYSWQDLADKIIFTSDIGNKDNFENYAFLPSSVPAMFRGMPDKRQWNYRILCHPLNRDLKTDRLVPVDDLSARMAHDRTLDAHAKSRNARFKVAPVDKSRSEWSNQRRNFKLIDELMAEIPGADNYPASIRDNSLNELVMDWRNPGKVLNAGYYHGWFKTRIPDAMGTPEQHRGFSDENVYMAATTSDGIAASHVFKCNKPSYEKCQPYSQRMTYAIPMEIVYLTPLYNWNPHNLTFKGEFDSDAGKTVNADGRNGSPGKPYDGTNSKKFYQTPAAFYTNDDGSGDTADTAQGVVHVADATGKAHQVVASGTRIILPEIPGAGKIRIRYPIMPVHQEGSAVWKELEALKDIVLNPKSQKDKFYEVPSGTGSTGSGGIPVDSSRMRPVQLRTDTANPEFLGHVHTISLTADEVLHLKKLGNFVQVTSSLASAHSHTLTVTNNGRGNYEYTRCDGRKVCFDGHPNTILYAHRVVASGTRIILPKIPGVGKIRIRYPIMPVHQEGSAVWKELEALKDIVLNPKSQKDKFYEQCSSGTSGSGSNGSGGTNDGSVTLKTKASMSHYGPHEHYVKLSPAQVKNLKTPGQSITVDTTASRGHTHKLHIAMTGSQYRYTSCDGRSTCFDQHAPELTTY